MSSKRTGAAIYLYQVDASDSVWEAFARLSPGRTMFYLGRFTMLEGIRDLERLVNQKQATLDSRHSTG